MANLKPARELTATQITLLPVNIPEKRGQAAASLCCSRFSFYQRFSLHSNIQYGENIPALKEEIISYISTCNLIH